MLAPETSFTFIPVQSHFHPPPPVKRQWPCGCIAQWTCHTVTLLKREWFYGLSSLLLDPLSSLCLHVSFWPQLPFLSLRPPVFFWSHSPKALPITSKNHSLDSAAYTWHHQSADPVPTPLLSRPLNGIFSRQNAQAEIWAPPLTFPLLSPTYTHVSRSLVSLQAPLVVQSTAIS